MGRQTSPIFCVSDNKFFSISNFHSGYIYVWAGLIPDWLHRVSSRGLKTFQSSPAQTHSHFLWDAKLPYNHCSNKRNFSISNFHGGYKYVWAVPIPDCFHRWSSRGHTTNQSSPAQTYSHFLWNAKLPYFHVFKHINSPPTQSSMAVTNMFEPGRILIGFIEDCLKDPKQFKSSPDQTHSHFLWDAKLPYNHWSNTKFFFNSNFHGGYKYVWAGLNPDWFHWGLSKGHKTIQSSPA